MQKKTVVLAVAAALMVPIAHAQKKGGDEKPEADNVIELYGKVYPEILRVSSKGATARGTATCTICDPAAGENGAIPGRNAIESSNSRFGLRGHEKIGPDLKAIFQLETQFRLDQNNTGFAQRDSFVGLSSHWGTVKLGRMDTPFKEYGDDISFMGVSSGNFTSTSTLNRHIGFGPENNAARFHERRVNAVQYESPDIGPAEFKVQYSTNETDTSTRHPHVWSFGGQLEFGPFSILAGHEIHWDLFGLSLNAPSAMRNNSDQNSHSKDEASEIAFKYKVGKHQFEVDANRKRYREFGMTATGKVQQYKNNSYMFIWEARWTPQWRTAFHYVKATKGSCSRLNAVCDTGGLEGSQTSAGVAYHFSRRTYMFLMASWVKNGYSAAFNTTEFEDINPGEDYRTVGLGIHTAW